MDFKLISIRPQFRGLAPVGIDYLQGTYNCSWLSKEKRGLKYKILGFSISKDLMSSNIFMNDLVQEEGKTKSFEIMRAGETYKIQTMFIGKTLKGLIDDASFFYETLEEI